MKKIKVYLKNMTRIQKVNCLIFTFVFALLLSITLPSLARYKNRTSITGASLWDGSVADKYKSGNGTESNPYIISNGSELAYFANQLGTNNYANTYFALSNDIVINNGVFSYDVTNGVQYTLNNVTYYVKEYTTYYYDNINREGSPLGNINQLNSLANFKGNFDGGSFSIYGLYMSQDIDELALFTNLNGNISNLYVDNSIIQGGYLTGGIASSALNSTIKNTYYSGNIIGKNITTTKSDNIVVPDQSYISGMTLTNQNLTITNIPFIKGNITDITLTGNITYDNLTTTVKYDNNIIPNGEFTINLGTDIKNNILFELISTVENSNVNLTNLKYNITYNYGISGGIVGYGDNITLENVINKSNVYASDNSAGLVGISNNSLTINKAYNTGTITSNNLSSGLVGQIKECNNPVIIYNSYNSGTSVNGLVANIVNSNNVSITNVFVSSASDYIINSVINSSVNVTNSYNVSGTSVKEGTITGIFNSTTISNLYTKDYMINTLTYKEYEGQDMLPLDGQKVWIYEENRLPILYIDDLSNPIARIHASTYSWDNLSYDLNSLRFNSSFAFSIEQVDSLRPFKEVYYYISNNKTPLTKTELANVTWSQYTNYMNITTEGFYVIYAKVVDNNNNVIYLNTDVMILDLSGSDITLSLNNNSWMDLRNSLNNIYINQKQNLLITAIDDLSGINNIKYYKSTNILTQTDLSNLSNDQWIDYTGNIEIMETCIVYTRVEDNSGFISYANTDIINYKGFVQSNLIIGRNTSELPNYGYVTDKSTISFEVSYIDSNMYDNTYVHNLKSNILLPINSIITLISEDKVYQYIVPTSEDIYNYNSSCVDGTCVKEATYPFTLFKEVGNVNNNYFNENNYYNKEVNEKYKIILDLSNTSLTTNYDNVYLYTEIKNSNNSRSTIMDTIKHFNIYNNVNGETSTSTLYLNTDYSGNAIILNTDATTSINLNSGFNYKYINTNKVYDSIYEDQNIGLNIKLVDSENNIITKDNFKNIMFKIGEKQYVPGNDSIVRINLENGLLDNSTILNIITSSDNVRLAEGTYYLKISNYTSFDGENSNNTYNEVTIPVTVSNTANLNYSYDVIMDEASYILSKDNATSNITFKILQNGRFKDPNIKVKLYKKDQLTAYNQDYTLIDLANYINGSLELYETNIYYAIQKPLKYYGYESTINNFELSFKTANFENTGYKLVFDLYDGTKKISTIEKKFIVK